MSLIIYQPMLQLLSVEINDQFLAGFGEEDPQMMGSSLTPVELVGNAEDCIRQSPILPFSTGNVSKPLDSAPEALLHEYSRLGDDKMVIQSTCKEEIFESGSPAIGSSSKQSMTTLSSQSVMKEVDSRLESQGRFPAVTIPKYLNLEPSLAMDWLEISWDELHIKERVGAGTYSAFLNRIYFAFL